MICYYGGTIRGSVENKAETKSCVLATHIDPDYDRRMPEKFQKRVKRYLSAEDRPLIYLRSTDSRGKYDEVADTIWHSAGGAIENDEKADALLDRFNHITHIGAYWEQCHRETWKDLQKGLYRRDEKDIYTVEMPLDLITGQDRLISTQVKSDLSRKWVIDILNSAYKEEFRKHHENSLGVKLDLVENPDPSLIWKIYTGRF